MPLTLLRTSLTCASAALRVFFSSLLPSVTSRSNSLVPCSMTLPLSCCATENAPSPASQISRADSITGAASLLGLAFACTFFFSVFLAIS